MRRDGGQGAVVKSDLSNGRESPVSEPVVRPGRKGIDSGPALCRPAFVLLQTLDPISARRNLGQAFHCIRRCKHVHTHTQCGVPSAC